MLPRLALALATLLACSSAVHADVEPAPKNPPDKARVAPKGLGPKEGGPKDTGPRDAGPKDAAARIGAAAQKEMDRVKALGPDTLVLRPVAIMCLTLPELQQWVLGAMARRIVDVDGCYPFQKAVRVAVLDYPGVLAAHVRLVVAPDSPAEISDLEFYTLPAQIVGRDQVAPSLLMDAAPVEKKP